MADIPKLFGGIDLAALGRAHAQPESISPLRGMNPNLASEFEERLTKMIKDFEEELEPTQEVGVRLVSFGQTVVFHLQDIGYYNPSLIRFYGRTENGEPVELIQHVSQISVLLMRVPALDPEQPRRIGFHARDDE
jgi:hypothetical protein